MSSRASATASVALLKQLARPPLLDVDVDLGRAESSSCSRFESKPLGDLARAAERLLRARVIVADMPNDSPSDGVELAVLLGALLDELERPLEQLRLRWSPEQCLASGASATFAACATLPVFS